jgi:hypothetical protein
MACRLFVLAMVALLAGASAAPAQEGRLSRIRDAVFAADEPTAQHGSRNGNACQDDAWSELLSDVVGVVAAYIIAAPFVVPARILGDDWEHRLYLSRYPYPHDYPGYLLLSPTDASSFGETQSVGLRRGQWGGRLAIEGGSDLNGVDRLAGQLRIDSAYRIGILTTLNYYREQQPAGGHDETFLGDFNVILRFAQNEIAHMYAGLGFRTMSDNHGNAYGFNFTYGGEWFPVRPLVVDASFDAGTLGNAGVLHGRATFGVVYRHYEIYGGYDFLRIGTVNLQGPMVGMRLWF